MFSNTNCSIFLSLTASQKLSVWIEAVFLEKKKKNQKKEMLLKHLLVENIRGTELSLNYWNAVVFFIVLVGEILLPVSVASFQGLKQKFNLFYLRRSEL